MRKSEALKDLERMANEYKRIMHPDIPTHALPRVTYSDANTNDMQTAIIDYIDLVGGWATRINTQGQYVESLGRFIPGSTKKGTADIHGVLPPHGRHISIECKKGKDKLSEKQQQVCYSITKAAGLYIEARDFETVYKTINQEINNSQLI